MYKTAFKISLYLTIISLLHLGCHGKIPAEKFVFNAQLKDLFDAAIKSDTMWFENDKGGIDTFVLTKLDSTIVNPNRDFCLPCGLPLKWIERKYKQYPINYWSQPKVENGKTNYEVEDEAAMITITSSPLDNSTSIYVSFKNFRGELINTLGKESVGILGMGEKHKAIFYEIDTNAETLITKESSLKSIFLSLKDGIVGYREKSGVIRRRVF